MTLLPFDIETAKFAIAAGTGRVVTREGLPVTITCWDTEQEGDEWPTEGRIHFPLEDISSLEAWTKEGGYSYYRHKKHKYDLLIETDLDV